jgi:phage gp16-like protein
MSRTRTNTHTASNHKAAECAKAAIEAKRKQFIRAIKATQRQLGMDDESYRQLLALHTGGKLKEDGSVTGGKHSATELTLPELSRVIEAMRRKGAPHPTRSGGRTRPAPAADRAELMAKVHALLAELGKVMTPAPTLRYADAVAKRNGWAECVDFCDAPALHKLVGALSRTLSYKLKAQAAS